MKKTVILGLTILFSSLSFTKEQPAYVLYNAKGKETTYEKMVENLEGKDYVFFGEYHNNPISHWLQYELTKSCYDLKKNDLILGAEMFEADNQYIMDEYLNGLISEKSFMDEVRLWPNYNTDYKPLLEFAKVNKLLFIATNIPRRYASMVYKKGVESLNSLSDLAKTYIVPLNTFEFDTTVNCYKELLNSDHGGYNMAIAQAIKDATMAYFIKKNLPPDGLFLHYNGAYHSDHYEGIIHYLKKDVSMEKIMTISTVTQADVTKLSEENMGIADFIICVPETMTTTH
ncbi:MAG: ChaN family lipoprotein [Crocinitomicaceae bacterium]|nr:ChaN family lipoprotein [Crocinitomicaceae bacterium]